MLETHDDPGLALSDGPQALPLEEMSAAVALVDAHRRNDKEVVISSIRMSAAGAGGLD